MDSEFGVLVGRGTTEFVRTCANGRHELWDAITDPPAVGAWFIPTPAVELRLGGRWTFVSPDDPLFRGTITAEPGNRLEYTYDNGSIMGFEIEETGPGCTLRFRHSLPADFVVQPGNVPSGYGWDEQPGGPGTAQPALNASWHGNLDALRLLLGEADRDAVAAVARREDTDPEAWRELVDEYRRLSSRPTAPKATQPVPRTST